MPLELLKTTSPKVPLVVPADIEPVLPPPPIAEADIIISPPLCPTLTIPAPLKVIDLASNVELED
jgi:hypothetical protein